MLLDQITAERAGAVGGKAAQLAALARTGARVPPAWVIVPGADVPDRIPVPGPWVVRSSASIEDSAAGGAPGVFVSVRDVGPDGLAEAVACVRASSRAPGALAYLAARDIDASAVAMAVIIQQQVRPEIARGTLYTQAPGDREHVLIEAHDGELVRAATLARSTLGELSRDPGFPIDGPALAQLARDAVSAESALGSPGRLGGVDVEWVLSTDGIWLVQARPITRAPVGRAPTGRPDPAALAFSLADPAVVWRWDVSHNPDPLTPAQIALVDQVAAIAPYAMRVVDGYLYTADDPRAPATPAASPAALCSLWQQTSRDIEAVLAPFESPESIGPPSLSDALAAYRQVFALYAPLSSALSAARVELGGRLGAAASRPAVMAVSPRHVGAISLAWDVGAPTLREGDALAATTSELDPTPTSRVAALDPTSPVAALDPASLVATIGEADDALFYRAQSLVRRALLGLARTWGVPDDDIFYFPLVNAARAQRERRRRLAMPLAIAGGRMLDAIDAAAGTDAWRGRGGGGWARGPVARVGDMGQLDGEPGVVVARAIMPGQLAQLRGAKAIVAEFGGILGHGAAMARELGVPYTVGCVGAWRELATGDEVVVDGDAGLVVRIRRARD